MSFLLRFITSILLSLYAFNDSFHYNPRFINNKLLSKRTYFNSKINSPRSYNLLLKDTNNDMNWDPKAAPKLDFNEDYYSVLEAPPNIDSKELKKQYYKIVFQYHPDGKKTEKEKELSNKQMMVINNAYKILKNDVTRKEYDIKRNKLNNNKKSTNPYTNIYSNYDPDKYDIYDYEAAAKRKQDVERQYRDNINNTNNNNNRNNRRTQEVNNFDRNAFFRELFEEDDLYADAHAYFNQDPDREKERDWHEERESRARTQYKPRRSQSSSLEVSFPVLALLRTPIHTHSYSLIRYVVVCI